MLDEELRSGWEGRRVNGGKGVRIGLIGGWFIGEVHSEGGWGFSCADGSWRSLRVHCAMVAVGRQKMGYLDHGN